MKREHKSHADSALLHSCRRQITTSVGISIPTLVRLLESGTIPGDGFEIQCSPISLSKSEDRYRRSRK